MKFTRRTLLGGLGVSMLPAGASAERLFPFRGRPSDVLEELGIRPIVNFRGTHTSIGASKMWPELHEKAAAISQEYVSLQELQEKIGERLSRLVGSEAALVTTGAAGSICLGTCASLTGEDVAMVRSLPDLTGMKTEVLIQKAHRNGYDHAVRNTGVRLIEVEDREQLERAVNEETAMMYFLGGTSHDWRWETPVSLEECLELSRRAGFPLMVDAANMLPPWDNIRRLAEMGVDLICISGGKHMRGPQCAGILAGRKDLIHAAWLNSNPHADSLGRPMKAGREEMVALWLAAEKYARLDFNAVDRECETQAAWLLGELGGIPGLRTEKVPFDRTRRIHRVHVQWDEEELGLTGAEVERQLYEGEPRIAVGRGRPQGIELTVFMNDPGEEQVAARRIREIFAAAKRSKS